MPAGKFVLDAGSDGECDVDESWLCGVVAGVCGRGFYDFGLSGSALGFEESALAENRQERVLGEVGHVIAGVFAIGETLGGGLEQGQLGRRRAGELGVLDADAHSGDVVVDRFEMISLVILAQKLDVAGDGVFDQKGLQNIVDLVG